MSKRRKPGFWQTFLKETSPGKFKEVKQFTPASEFFASNKQRAFGGAVIINPYAGQ